MIMAVRLGSNGFVNGEDPVKSVDLNDTFDAIGQALVIIPGVTSSPVSLPRLAKRISGIVKYKLTLSATNNHKPASATYLVKIVGTHEDGSTEDIIINNETYQFDSGSASCQTMTKCAISYVNYEFSSPVNQIDLVATVVSMDTDCSATAKFDNSTLTPTEWHLNPSNYNSSISNILVVG